MTKKPKVGWLVDADAFDYLPSLLAAIEEQGDSAKVVRPPPMPYSWDGITDNFQSAFPPDACVVTQGDIDLVRRVQAANCWRPGVFAGFDNLRCSSYYCHLGEHLLNGEYAMLPLGELSRCRKFLFRTFGQEGRIFVRPDSPLKTFTGQLVSRECFDADLELLAFYDVPPHEIVLVSRPREIVSEWRFVAGAGRIFSGCRYKDGGRFAPDAQFDPTALRLAEQIALGSWQPEPVWIIDICQTVDGEFHLLEIGGFSCASLYKCDLAAVVRGVSDVAAEVWLRG